MATNVADMEAGKFQERTVGEKSSVRTTLVNSDGVINSANYPISADGDSVYEKDIDLTNSDIGDFSGSITDLFNNIHTTVTTSTDNPTLTIHLSRPISNQEIVLSTPSGNFSNIKIIAKDSAGNTVETIDDSSNNTKYTINQYNFVDIDKWCEIVISFTTTDDVTLGYICITKAIHTHAHLHALKPDGTVTAIDATAGGNLKVSAEETETDALKDLMLEIPAGNRTGYSSVNKFGSNPNSTADTVLEVWDGVVAYTFPTTASITHARAGVNSAITRGMVVEVQGLDTDYAAVTQNVTLDATDSTTEVALGTALRRVFRMKVLDADVTDQQIWVGATGFASKQAIIQIGMNQTLMAIYTIPAGKTAYMTSYYGDYVRDAVKDPDGVEFYLWAKDNVNGYAKQIKHQKGVPKQSSGFQHEFKPYFKITEKTDIYMTALADNADAHIHGGFDLILVDN